MYRNLIPKVTLGLLLFAVAYVLVRTAQVGPWPDDFGDKIDWDVVFIQVLPSASFTVNFLLALRRSLKGEDYAWTIAIVVLCPLSLWYTLLVNKGLGANNSFKPNPLRGSA